jgi:hypothetical protein
MRPFELPETTQVICTNVNTRRELHGSDGVMAFDAGFMLTGPNTLLDLIEPGLREEYYFNAARKKGQKALLADEPLPNLRRPKVPNEGIPWDKGSKSRGYRIQQDWGTNEAVVDLTDAVMYGVKFDCLEGGTVNIYFGIQYNGEELDDNDTLARIVRWQVTRDIHIRLLAPPELLKVSKGYRANRPDTPSGKGASDPDQQELDGGQDGQDDAGDERTDTSTPTGAFLAAGEPAVKH